MVPGHAQNARYFRSGRRSAWGKNAGGSDPAAERIFNGLSAAFRSDDGRIYLPNPAAFAADSRSTPSGSTTASAMRGVWRA